MAFKALSDKTAIRAAFKQFKHALCQGVKPVERNVGYQGGNLTGNVYWLKKERFWALMESDLVRGRTWSAFGVDDPHGWKTHSIVCEINSPTEGVNRNIAGAFVTDLKGGLSVAHSGKIGGGRKGIGQSAFLQHCRCASVPVAFSSGVTTDMLIIGALNSTKLRAEVGYFVREVQRVKALLLTRDNADTKPPNQKFTPEFTGKKQAFIPGGSVEAVATHGLVVDALVNALQLSSLKPYNDKNRDLFVGAAASPSHIFEVKTDATPYSIYTGIGQLMVHGRGKSRTLKRVLVLPELPPKWMKDRLEALQVTVLTYSWDHSKAVLKGLKQVL